MMLRTTKEIGNFGEAKAVHFLRWRGYMIRERNWRTGNWEIDIIAETRHDLVFVEVKTRTYTSEELEYGVPPGRAVNAEKQRHTRQAAQRYLRRYPTRKQPRMDVIEVWLVQDASLKKPKVAKIHHIKAAY